MGGKGGKTDDWQQENRVKRKKEKEMHTFRGGGRQSVCALEQDAVSMVTSAGYQEIEALSVCLYSSLALSIQKHNSIHFILQPTVSYVALYFAQLDQKHCLAA